MFHWSGEEQANGRRRDGAADDDWSFLRQQPDYDADEMAAVHRTDTAWSDPSGSQPTIESLWDTSGDEPLEDPVPHAPETAGWTLLPNGDAVAADLFAMDPADDLLAASESPAAETIDLWQPAQRAPEPAPWNPEPPRRNLPGWHPQAAEAPAPEPAAPAFGAGDLLRDLLGPGEGPAGVSIPTHLDRGGFAPEPPAAPAPPQGPAFGPGADLLDIALQQGEAAGLIEREDPEQPRWRQMRNWDD